MIVLHNYGIDILELYIFIYIIKPGVGEQKWSSMMNILIVVGNNVHFELQVKTRNPLLPDDAQASATMTVLPRITKSICLGEIFAQTPNT